MGHPTTHASPDPQALWAALDLYRQHRAFAVGQVWLSPGGYRFEVVHVAPDGRACMNKQGPGWFRQVEIKADSPKLHDWALISQAPA